MNLIVSMLGFVRQSGLVILACTGVWRQPNMDICVFNDNEFYCFQPGIGSYIINLSQ